MVTDIAITAVQALEYAKDEITEMYNYEKYNHGAVSIALAYIEKALREIKPEREKDYVRP